MQQALSSHAAADLPGSAWSPTLQTVAVAAVQPDSPPSPPPAVTLGTVPPPGPANAADPQADRHSSPLASNPGAIAGIVIGGCAILLLIALAIFVVSSPPVHLGHEIVFQLSCKMCDRLTAGQTLIGCQHI